MKTLMLLTVTAIVAINASAQTTVQDSVDNRVNQVDQYSKDKAQQAERLRDSAAESGALTQQEREVLNRDYNRVQQDYEQKRKEMENGLSSGKIDSAEARRLYNHDYNEFQRDSTAIYNQHHRFNKAVQDGITPQEREAMEKQYKKDKRHYKDDKKKVNHQKEMIKDSTDNQ